MPRQTKQGCLETFENHIKNSDFDEEHRSETSRSFALNQPLPEPVSTVFPLPSTPAAFQVTFGPGCFKVFTSSVGKQTAGYLPPVESSF